MLVSQFYKNDRNFYLFLDPVGYRWLKSERDSLINYLKNLWSANHHKDDIIFAKHQLIT